MVEELKDYNSILSKIQTTQDNLEKQEEELYKKRVAVFDKSINLVEIEQKTREQAAKDEYEQVRLAIEKELTNRKIKSAEKKRLLELEKLNESNLIRLSDISWKALLLATIGLLERPWMLDELIRLLDPRSCNLL